MTNNGKTEYRNELLSWTGYEGDTTNLTSIIGGFGDDNHVSIRITGYFSPVVTTDYRFRFVDNDDLISLNLVEFGNDINSGGISLTRLIEGNRTETSDPITLDSTKTYEFKIIWKQASGPYTFQPQVDIGNNGTFVDFYNTSNFDFKVYNDYNPLNLITSSHTNYNISDNNVGINKFTYLIFSSNDIGSTSLFKYDNSSSDWIQYGNSIAGSAINGWGGFKNSLNSNGNQIAVTDIRHNGGTVRLLKYDPYGTSIRNFYGSGIDSASTILANNQKLYQGSYITSPNGNYVLNFQDSNGNLVLRSNFDTNLSIETDYDNFTVEYNFLIQDKISEGNPNTYIVMEDGNLNVYDNGQHKLSFTSDSKSGVLALDNNGNLSIVENWIELTSFSGSEEEGFGLAFSGDGTILASSDYQYNSNQGRTRIYKLKNELTLANGTLIEGDTVEISVDVSDGNVRETRTFNVNRVNSNAPPVFTSSGVLTADEDSVYTYNIEINDVQTCTITADTIPTWLTLTDNGNNTATLTGTPLQANLGDNSVVLKATDTLNTSTTQSFTISVANVNDPPVFTSTAITSIDEDSVYTYNITVSDEDNDTCTISASTIPNWLSLTDNENNTATLTGTPIQTNVQPFCCYRC